MAKIAVIGSGFSGLSVACYLSQEGHEVHVYEKNETIGGRARQIKTKSGYIFDMGPSWYWMPDVFESFFQDFGYKVSDFYNLKLLNPAFELVFGEGEKMSIPENFQALCELFESIEPGAAASLKKFMKAAKYKYETGMQNIVHKPGLSLREFADMKLFKGVLQLQVFSSFSKHIRKYFSHPHLISLMEFPILFLGAMPNEIPALYSLMNYAGLKLGTWYPEGGFGKIIDAMVQVAQNNGVQFYLKAAVEKINIEKNKAKSITVRGVNMDYDAIIASSDYHHVESQLLPKEYRNYDEKYWDKKTFAPSCLIYYLGINKKIKKLQHHSLFFDEDFEQHAIEIYKQPQWPGKPLFYVCAPSKSDKGIAPIGHENLFLLMPIAPGLKDDENIREKYFQIMISRLEKHVDEEIQSHIDYKESYSVKNFISDYNAYKGNAYGLANTLRQTAILKPKIINKKVENLIYTGQLTVPGPGVPPAIISGKIASELLIKYLKNKKNEILI